MKSRRDFIKKLTVGGAAITTALHSNAQVMATNSILRSGNWSDPTLWSLGRLPNSTDLVFVGSGLSLRADINSTFAGATVNGSIVYEPTLSVTLQSSKNIVVNGRLQMIPQSFAQVHTLRFINVNEQAFTGGGMNVITNDIGLWVMNAGRLVLIGSTKTAWVNSPGINQGTQTLNIAPTGWQVGDQVVISPTNRGSANFHASTIAAINTGVTLSTATTEAHPAVNNRWMPEVLNLTRNVNIEGTTSGYSHIFIHSSVVHTIKYVGLRYMGPRKDINGDGIKEFVSGRYGLHFHHCNDSSRTTIVEGCVVRDANSHAYVPHTSHGITFRNNISYNTLETAFWWDPGHATHDTLYDHNIVAKCYFVPGSLNVDAENAPTFSSSGFALNTGDGNSCINNVVISGGEGDFADGGAYNWEAVINEGIWNFKGNLAHNCNCGLRVWQNSTRNHVIEDFDAYNNTVGIFHGAYANSYTYNGGYIYACDVQIKAASTNSNRVRLENYIIDGAGVVPYGLQIIHSPLAGEEPIFVRATTIKNCTIAAVLDSAAPEVHSVDLIQCNITGALQVHPQAATNETIRVQPTSGSPYKITKSGQSFIAAFAPSIWGVGKGLKGEYFNSDNFTNLALTRTDSNVSFSEWSQGVHYSIPSTIYSVRWTGQVQAQYSENYTFHVGTGGGVRLWVDNQLILDKWNEVYPTSYASTPIALVAGQAYNIKLEYFNTEGGTGVGLYWTSISQKLEYIPQSQLYSGAVTPPPPPAPPTEEEQIEVSCAPNPFSNTTTLSVVCPTTAPSTVTVYNSNGNVQLQFQFPQGSGTTSGAGDWNSGTYTVNVVQGSLSKSITIIKM